MRARTVLIIEDSGLMRLQVKQMLEQADFQVKELNDANELLANVWRYQDVAAMLLDINLPIMNGLAVLRAMNERQAVSWPPVIIVSASSDKATIKEALSLGARDYIIKPVSAEMLIAKIHYALAHPAAPKFRQRYLNLVQAVKETYDLYKKEEYKKFPKDLVAILCKECTKIVHHDEIMVLFQDHFNMAEYSFRHTVNVAVLSGLIAKWMDLKDQEIQDIVLAGLLHDLGKSIIPRDILLKPDSLSNEEMEFIKRHPVAGYNLVQHEGYSPAVLLGISQHHERMDGSGYPNGLLAKDISLVPRIVAIADVYDAMTSNKAYRQAETPFTVIEELFREMFNKLDPHICSVFLRNVKGRMVGKKVRLSDGSEAMVTRIAGDGFGEPVLEDSQGRCIALTNSLQVVEVM